jgi:hypothetical protein
MWSKTVSISRLKDKTKAYLHINDVGDQLPLQRVYLDSQVGRLLLCSGALRQKQSAWAPLAAPTLSPGAWQMRRLHTVMTVPDSSWAASAVATVVFCGIMVSTIAFLLSTVPPLVRTAGHGSLPLAAPTHTTGAGDA